MKNQTEERVCPAHLVDPSFAREFIRLFPDVLLLQHPVLGTWQAYETGRSNWTAERLRHVITVEHEHQVANDPIRYPRTFWWNWRGAPVLIDNLPRAPGTWLIEWLASRDGAVRKETARAFLRRIEEEGEARTRRATTTRRDRFHAVAHEARRHIRDAVRGDSLAGRRKWLISKS